MKPATTSNRGRNQQSNGLVSRKISPTGKGAFGPWKLCEESEQNDLEIWFAERETNANENSNKSGKGVSEIMNRILPAKRCEYLTKLKLEKEKKEEEERMREQEEREMLERNLRMEEEKMQSDEEEDDALEPPMFEITKCDSSTTLSESDANEDITEEQQRSLTNGEDTPIEQPSTSASSFLAVEEPPPVRKPSAGPLSSLPQNSVSFVQQYTNFNSSVKIAEKSEQDLMRIRKISTNTPLENYAQQIQDFDSTYKQPTAIKLFYTQKQNPTRLPKSFFKNRSKTTIGHSQMLATYGIGKYPNTTSQQSFLPIAAPIATQQNNPTPPIPLSVVPKKISRLEESIRRSTTTTAINSARNRTATEKVTEPTKANTLTGLQLQQSLFLRRQTDIEGLHEKSSGSGRLRFLPLTDSQQPEHRMRLLQIADARKSAEVTVSRTKVLPVQELGVTPPTASQTRLTSLPVTKLLPQESVFVKPRVKTPVFSSSSWKGYGRVAVHSSRH